ncbi:MAG: hypothetical protein AAFP70_13965, partial [Calditrichota bacterium]
YIWLDQIEVGKFSTSDGTFNIQLPPKANQPGNGFSGSATLYCYVGNYRIKTRQILLNDGDFLYGQGDVSNVGELLQPFQMTKLLDITTSVTPEIISPDVDELLTVRMNLRSTNDPVRVSLTGADSTLFANIVAVRVDTTAFIGVPIQRGTTFPVSLQVTGSGTTLVSDFTIPQNVLAQGEYQIVPSLWLENTGVPTRLLSSLNTQAATYDAEYALLPFDRQGGDFSVSVSKDSTEAP